ncbi:MAG: sigma-70 family RNA polymerase sigma factor [Polyangiaceae bacterium]
MSVATGEEAAPLTAAQQKLVAASLQWARDVVRRLGIRYGAVLERKDIEQLAAEGLSRAARGYDRERGVPFTVYALKFVRGSVKRAGNFERRFHDSLFDAADAVREEGDLFEETDEDARDKLFAHAEVAAAEMFGGGLGRATGLLARTGEDSMFQAITHQQVRAALTTLPDRPREVVERRIFEGQEVDTVADAMNISSATVRRDYQDGLRRLARRLGGALSE